MVTQFSERDQAAWREVVWKDPDRMSGALCFRGTRVPVQTLADYLKGGHSLDDFLEGFPTVEREQARQFLDLATKLVDKATAQEDQADTEQPA